VMFVTHSVMFNF